MSSISCAFSFNSRSTQERLQRYESATVKPEPRGRSVTVKAEPTTNNVRVKTEPNARKRDRTQFEDDDEIEEVAPPPKAPRVVQHIDLTGDSDDDYY
jgi:hypothetical protein